MAIGVSLCELCKHYQTPGPFCAAFPKGIPNKVFNRLQDHRKPIRGDHGIGFELVDNDPLTLEIYHSEIGPMDN